MIFILLYLRSMKCHKAFAIEIDCDTSIRKICYIVAQLIGSIGSIIVILSADVLIV